MPKNQKEYTGTWIPAHVMEDQDITATAKIMYGFIANFETCYASNQWFAKHLNIKLRNVQYRLTELEDKGYVFRTDDEKGNRIIIALLDKGVQRIARGGAMYDMGGVQQNAPIYNNINNNIDNPIVPFSEDIKRLYHGWLIEFIIGSEVWLSLYAEQRVLAMTNAEKKLRLTPKRKDKFRIRLEDAGFKMCARAIKNIAKSDFHRGENNTGWKVSPEWLFNSYEKIEEWANKK